MEDEADGAAPDVPWEEKARRRQQLNLQWLGHHSYSSFRRRIPSICNLLLTGFCKCHEGDGFCDNDSELSMLKTVIGYALFGLPTEDPSDVNGFTGYAKDKVGMIQKVFDQIVKHQKSDKILMALLYVSLDNHGTVVDSVVFRVPNPKHVEGGTDEYWFVDSTARLYKNWGDFLSNNKLPASKCCLPKDGVYTGDSQGQVELSYGLTPAAKLSSKALKSLDTMAFVTSVGAGIGAFFPPVAMSCAAACGVLSVYSIIRGSVELADRGNHGQSVVDREAGHQWLSIIGSTLGLGSAGARVGIKLLATEGKTASDLICRFVTGLDASCLLVNGVGIVENIITIKKQDGWSALQLFQLTTSVIFFCHSVVNFKTARSLYEETQNQILDHHRANLSKRQRKLFDGIQKETLIGEPNPVIGKAKIIKDLNHISDKNEFFSRIFKSNKNARKNSEPVEKVKFGELFTSEEQQSFSSGRNFVQHSTVCSTPQGVSVGPKSSHYVKPHEPALFVNIKSFLHSISACEIEKLLVLLVPLCEHWKYGRQFLDVLRIIIDLRNCSNIQEAIRIVQVVMDLGSKLWEDLIQWRLSSEQRERENLGQESHLKDQLNEDEEMGKIVGNVSFIPCVLNSLSSKELEEEVFHFPTDHRSWGENGELELDDYIVIGQNAFGIFNVQGANVRHEDDTASVYIEHVGLVTVTSYVREQKIVVKRFPKSWGDET